MTKLSEDRRRELVDVVTAYCVVNPANGKITYKRSGKVASVAAYERMAAKGQYRYPTIFVSAKRKRHTISTHIAVWILTHGAYPPGELDHINRNRGDNRPDNLRLSTGVENALNKEKKSGLPPYIVEAPSIANYPLYLDGRVRDKAGHYPVRWKTSPVGSELAAYHVSAIFQSALLGGLEEPPLPKPPMGIALSHLDDMPFQVGVGQSARYFPTIERAQQFLNQSLLAGDQLGLRGNWLVHLTKSLLRQKAPSLNQTTSKTNYEKAA